MNKLGESADVDAAQASRYYDNVAVLLMRWADEVDELGTGPEVGYSLESPSALPIAEL
jgi:hypothetical protein